MKKLLLLVVAVLCTQALFAQLKIGDNPTTINKSSILELESHYQGLLLTRIADTANDINPFAPPDGMIIYFTDSSNRGVNQEGPNSGLYVRANGGWQELSSAGSLSDSSWTLKGNAGTDSTKNFLGTRDNEPLIFKTNDTERLRLRGDGQLNASSGTIGAGTNQLQVLVIDPTGNILQRTVPASIFDNAIVSLNGLRDTVQTFAIDSTGAASNFNITSASTGGVGVHTIHLPFQAGTGAVNWGLLSYTDWLRFDSAAKNKLLFSAFTDIADARGVTINGDSLILHAATATTPGGVSADDQTFGGAKTFADSVNVGTGSVNMPLTVNGKLLVSDSAHFQANATVDSTLILTTRPDTATTGQNYVLIRDSVSGKVVERAINSGAFKEIVTGHDSAQKDIFIDSSNNSQLKINIPYASQHVNGIVDTVFQDFGGNKTFSDSVAAAKAVNIGSTADANSTLELTGSLAMTITNTSASAYTVTGTDNTVLANCTGGSITITLPSTAGIAGRVITIKKVGTGGINNELDINPVGGATIDGGLGYKIYNDWTFVTMQTDGANWYIIKR